MGRQSRLVLLLLLSIGVLQVARTSTPHSVNIVHDDILNNELDASDELYLSQKAIHISTPKDNEAPQHVSTASSVKKESSTSTSTSTSTTHKPVSDEILNNLIEASKHSVALADDPRFNKMLPEKFKVENSTTTKKNEDDSTYDDSYDDNYDYDEDYNYDETSTEPAKKSKDSSEKLAGAKKEIKKPLEMKPFKEDAKLTSKSKVDSHTNLLNNDDNQTNNVVGDDQDDEDDYSDDDDDDDDDDLADEEEIVFNENVPCPRDCICERNINSYLVATCSRFDLGTQKFGSDITDLIVTDVGPKYPIHLGKEIFSQMGLKHVSSIKIANCTIQYLHPEAFHGLDELYAVNLTSVGLTLIEPDTFVENTKLRMLTITGNDLSEMSNLHYLLKSSGIEELDLSRNNLMELNPTAFSQLSNIVYINLSQNNLRRIPERVFDSVETIEELDLSYNELKSLPATIFNRTALAILHLKYNAITGDLNFGTNDIQQLDLSFNSINQVHHGMFDKMVGLTNLNLKGNGITKIQPDSFLTLKNLRHIDLSINELDQVSTMMFYKNSELDVIRLNDNPRLSQLPTDGFLSYNGYFTVYYMDISSCAIGALGHKTFSTMPHLATLKLAWNNINNLERDTFASLNKLIDLDLSNNLINKLDELTFMNNNDLTKLNLAGNTIRKLSVRLFLPMNQLRELDVSECELTSLLADNQYGVGRKYKFYDTLRSFNASANKIERVSSVDIKNFKNLRTLDISRNPLRCNEEFQDFISYASLNTNMVPNMMPSLANIESASSYAEFQPHSGWSELAHEVCKHHDMLHKSKEEKFETRIEQADKDLDEDAKNLLNIMENRKLNKLEKILKDSRKSEVVIDDHLNDSSEDEEDLNNGGEDKDDEEENESDYEDDDDDDDDEDENADKDAANDDDDDDDNIEDDYTSYGKKHGDRVDLSKVKDHGLKVNEVELSKETKDKFLLNKFVIDGDENDDSSEEEIIIERGRIYYSGYKFLIPVVIMVACVIVILLAIGKIVTMVMRKRGERYRMALLASSNNSIVYQKLSEEIKPTEKESKQPKVHRYALINQV